MQCPKCQFENPDTTRFCRRCHMTLLFVCPACQHTQRRGGKCEKCGVDFIKYALVIESQMEARSRQTREVSRTRGTLAKQALLLPLTGGLSLFKFVRTMLRGE